MKSHRSTGDPDSTQEEEPPGSPKTKYAKDIKDEEEDKPRLVDEELSTTNLVATLVSSAPTSSCMKQYQPSTVTPEILETIEKCTKRSKSSLEGSKYKCAITSERLAQLRKTVENATKDHKIFTIKGGWPVIRRELLKRHWIEKNETSSKQKYSCMEDVTNNLPIKQEWESPTTYVEKCEKTVMSRMLQNYDVDLYWSMRKEPSDLQHRSNTYKLINRFSRSLFASKEGLALLLQQSYWYVEEGVANINFPRCYVLGFPDHYKLFVDDFRLTACTGLLKWFIEKYEMSPTDKNKIVSPEGQVPYAALQFAIERLEEYTASQKHLDLDKEFNRIWDHEWEQFLTQYYRIVHDQELFTNFKEPLSSTYSLIKKTIKEFSRFWPQFDIDGMKNIWIMKPGNKCRGRGIQLVKNVADVEKVMGLKVKYVVQKYIERPLIIYQTKFDIRQWFMVTNVQPLTIWMYRDSYLRFSGQVFNLDNFHESLHLTNYAVQCKYTNGLQRDKLLPDDNMWDCHTFQNYLKKIGQGEKWDEVIYPGMRESIVCAMLASQDTMDRRQNTFEIYGADFMLSEDFRPWLLEINCSPDLSFSTKVTSKLCPRCMEDIIKVMVDRRKDSNAETGLFEMIFKQNYPRTPAYLGMNLSVRGRRIFRNRAKSRTESLKQAAAIAAAENNKLDKSGDIVKDVAKTAQRKKSFIGVDILSDNTIKKSLPKILSPNLYKGPVIADLIEELQRSVHDEDSGVDFVLPIKIEPHHHSKSNDRKKSDGHKAERVPKYCLSRHKINKSTSLCRKPISANENTNRPHRHHRQQPATKSGAQHRVNSSCFGLFKEWTGMVAQQDNNVWQKDTVSILKGETLLNKSGFNSISGLDEVNNKNNVINNSCLSCQTFDLNKLLPQINSAGGTSNRANDERKS